MFLINNISRYVFICWLMLFMSVAAAADNQRIIDYRYDTAGNIIAVRSFLGTAPTVLALSPPFVNLERPASIIATGTNLASATVSTEVNGLQISNIVNISDTAIRFIVHASVTVPIGQALLTFTNRLSTGSASLIVAERTPIISTDPNSLILSPNGQAVSVSLLFDQTFETEQIFDIEITDSTIASLSAETLILAAGETEVSVQIVGLLVGSTSFQINQLSKFMALAIPVTVNQGLSVGRYELQASNSLGVVLGTTADRHDISQVELLAGYSESFSIYGINLTAVTAVIFLPANSGVIQIGEFLVNDTGTVLSIEVTVAEDAPSGIVDIILATSNGAQLTLQSNVYGVGSF